MARTVSAAEAKNRFGAILQAAREGEEIIVARHGKGDVAIIPASDLDDLHAFREKQAREDALRRLEALRAKVQEANRASELTDAQVEEIAEEISREALRRLVERGEISFEREG